MEILTTELQGWQEKCALITKELEKKKEEINCLKKQALVASDENKRLQSVQLEEMEEEIRKLKHDRSSLEAQLDKKDKEIQKANDSRDNTMKTMREAFEVAKAKKAEYEVKLATVREQCRQELKREMDEELRRTKRDFQRLLNDKDKSLEGIRGEKESVEKTLAVERAETSKTDSSASVRNSVHWCSLDKWFLPRPTHHVELKFPFKRALIHSGPEKVSSYRNLQSSSLNCSH